MPDYNWYTIEEARDDWRDAAQLSDELLQLYLDAAQDDVWAFGRNITLPDDTPVPTVIPAGWRNAHLAQARNRWNELKTDPEGIIGSSDFFVRPYPLDRSVRQMIRPKTSRPALA